MPRALSIQRSVVPLADRRKFLEKLRARHAYYTGANCRFWAFEESDLAGAFMEFIEAGDVATLSRALAAAPEQMLEQVRIYQEVELD